MMESALFQSRLADLQGLSNTGDPLFRLRKQAWDRFLEKGLPDKKSETFQYIKLRKLFAMELTPAKKEEIDFQKWVYPECKNSYLVFINGIFAPEVSKQPLGMEILPLREAVFSFGTYLNNQWSRTLKEEQDPFALMNGALFSEGALVYVPPKKVFDTPLQILFITTAPHTLAVPRVELFLGALSQLKVATSHVALQGNSFVNAFLNAQLEEGSSLSLTQVATEAPNLWIFDAVRAHVKQNASLATYMATSGSETIRFDYQVELAGENGQIHLNGLWMLKGTLEAHVHVLMKHLAPHCQSLQLFKGALAQNSRSSFEGKILVQKEAQKTDSFQLNNNLLLSDTAQANSKPNLEIFADDVKASHGATVGQLDPEELFYLATRGFEKNEAKAILTRAFLREVLAKIELPSIQAKLIQHSEAFLC